MINLIAKTQVIVLIILTLLKITLIKIINTIIGLKLLVILHVVNILLYIENSKTKMQPISAIHTILLK